MSLTLLSGPVPADVGSAPQLLPLNLKIDQRSSTAKASNIHVPLADGMHATRFDVANSSRAIALLLHA